MAESLFSSSETLETFLAGYTPIKIKKDFKKEEKKKSRYHRAMICTRYLSKLLVASGVSWIINGTINVNNQ